MKKNSQLHLFIETEILDNLKKQASEEGISLSELCRKRLKDNVRLERIENILHELIKKLKT